MERVGHVAFKAGDFQKDGILKLDKERHAFEAYVSIHGLGEPTISKDVLRFFAADVDGKDILCEVAAPAIVPKPK